MADEEKGSKKGGLTVQELENYTRKYQAEIALGAMFVLTCIFALIWGEAMRIWSIILAMAFALVAVLLPKPTHKVTTATCRFLTKMDMVMKILVAIIGILLSIFLPPVIFAIVGLMGGKACFIDSLPGASKVFECSTCRGEDTIETKEENEQSDNDEHSE